MNKLVRIEPGNRTHLVQETYAVHITNNPSLRQLWDWNIKSQINITLGSISLHNNARLCLKEIHALEKFLLYNNSQDHIGYETNGYEEACQISEIKASAKVDSPFNATISWPKFKIPEDKKLMGYYLYYAEADFQNVTYYTGADACSP